MKPAAPRLFPISMIALAAIFAWGVLYLFGMQFSAGGVYPEYSTLRSDPMGAKLLYDALARLPGTTVERNYQPFEFLPAAGSTLVLLAVNPDALTDLRTLEGIARRGNRVVLSFAVQEKQPADSKPQPLTAEPLLARWGVKLAADPSKDIHHRLYFAAAKDWTSLDSAAPALLAIERNFGPGSIVLFAGSTDFANESTVAGDRLRLVAAALGPARRVIFDEQHLGIAESGTVVGLARQLHLTGFAIGLVLCAAVFLWRNGAAFPPAAAAADARPLLGRTAQAGLTTLLRRHIPARELAAVCLREWAASNRGAVPAERLRRAQAIAQNAAAPAAALREIETLLHAKGEL